VMKEGVGKKREENIFLLSTIALELGRPFFLASFFPLPRHYMLIVVQSLARARGVYRKPQNVEWLTLATCDSSFRLEQKTNTLSRACL
jgi:hypothetical protein